MFQLLLAVIYLSFISLGLPDALLGAAWPTLYPQLGVPVSYMGIVSVIISVGTIVSSLQSDRMTLRFGTGRVTVVSVAMTAAALLGFSCSNAFWQLLLWAVPYGLGAGGVDASLNNYVALHYESRHMSWLHCMWGIGASTGPYVMAWALTGGHGWTMGYRVIALLQMALTALLLCTLPQWKARPDAAPAGPAGDKPAQKPLTMGQILAIPGAKAVLVCFMCYCALEQTAGMWAASYLVLHRGVDAQTAASFASLFYLGITVGRGINGFLTLRWNDTQLIRLGMAVELAGAAALLLPLGEAVGLVGLVLLGLGCAPIYPCIIHSTPAHFGAENSQAIVGVQMASAYVGSMAAPPVFGLIANHIHIGLYPVYLLAILAVMCLMHELLVRQSAAAHR